MTVETPSSPASRAKSVARSAVTAVQPFTATSPSLASMPTARRGPWAAAISRRKAGSVAARVPMTTREAPASKAASAAATERIPPPNWTLGPSEAMRRSVGRLRASPPKAPSRSTTWIHSAPSRAKRTAGSTGSSK